MFEGNFCPNCGQKPNSGRLIFRESMRDVLEHYFDFDTPLFRTFTGLFKNPGIVIKEYIFGKRKSYAHPLRYFILTLAVYLIVKNLIGFNPIETVNEALSSTNPVDSDAPYTRASNFFASHINSFLLIYTFTLALFSKAFFWKSKYFFIEHLAVGFYIVAQYIIITTLVVTLTLISPKFFLINYLIVFLFPLYVFTSFHDGYWALKLIKSLFAVFLAWIAYAMIGFYLALFIIITFNL